MRERLKALGFLARHPRRALGMIVEAQTLFATRETKTVELSSLTEMKKQVVLRDFALRDGNVSSYELLALCQLIVNSKPKTILELGTFDGNTTLQMALNAPEAVIHTLDLPPSCTDHPELDPHEKKYVTCPKERKFEKMGLPITQHLGDSLTYDFSQFGRPNFIFIDASHSYTCVKNDSEKALKILAPGGICLWHDYTPIWPGVFRYLNELTHHIQILHIANTTFGYFQKI